MCLQLSGTPIDDWPSTQNLSCTARSATSADGSFTSLKDRDKVTGQERHHQRQGQAKSCLMFSLTVAINPWSGRHIENIQLWLVTSIVCRGDNCLDSAWRCARLANNQDDYLACRASLESMCVQGLRLLPSLENGQEIQKSEKGQKD